MLSPEQRWPGRVRSTSTLWSRSDAHRQEVVQAMPIGLAWDDLGLELEGLGFKIRRMDADGLAVCLNRLRRG
jgi:hypothetical protein